MLLSLAHHCTCMHICMHICISCRWEKADTTKTGKRRCHDAAAPVCSNVAAVQLLDEPQLAGAGVQPADPADPYDRLVIQLES